MTKTIRGIGVVGISGLLAMGFSILNQPVSAADADISGVVTSAVGPEAGVWVIAETNDFDSTFMKIVVTNEYWRYLVRDLEAANYEVWVRGYGLVDSDPASARPGDELTLTAHVAATPEEAAY